MDRFHLINVFVAVVDTNGLAGAARKLNMSPPAVTRAINELETHLGLRLLTRTTRTVRVTDAGERYVQDCRRILAEMLGSSRISEWHARIPPREANHHSSGAVWRDVRHRRHGIPDALPGGECVLHVSGSGRQSAG